MGPFACGCRCRGGISLGRESHGGLPAGTLSARHFFYYSHQQVLCKDLQGATQDCRMLPYSHSFFTGGHLWSTCSMTSRCFMTLL